MKNKKLNSVRLMLVSLFAFSLLCVSAAQAQDRHVQVVNRTSHTMLRFYASNVSRPGWEEDILGLDTLVPGQSVLVDIDDGTGYCHFDLKAVFSDGSATVRYNVDVCTVARWTIYE